MIGQRTQKKSSVLTDQQETIVKQLLSMEQQAAPRLFHSITAAGIILKWPAAGSLWRARIPWEVYALSIRSWTGWDIAYAALYLTSDESAMVTGISLDVDGGRAI